VWNPRVRGPPARSKLQCAEVGAAYRRAGGPRTQEIVRLAVAESMTVAVFATLVSADNKYDRISNLDRPGVFRLNLGVRPLHG
jgi:hypothetical protein